MSSSIPPANIPVIDENGFLNPTWYRYLASLQRATDVAVNVRAPDSRDNN